MKTLLNLETAVQGDKVMQDFELESLTIGGEHSQKVKAPPIISDYGSKDCVNLSPSTAVSRIKEEPQKEKTERGAIAREALTKNKEQNQTDIVPQAASAPFLTEIAATKTAKQFILETSATPAKIDLQSWWNLCQSLFNDWPLCKIVPCDRIAKRNKETWLQQKNDYQIIILSFNEQERELLFLKNIAKAMTLRFSPAVVLPIDKIKKEAGWKDILTSSSLKLMIACDYDFYLHPELMEGYREVPQEGKHYFNQTPLLLLSNLSLYLKEPQLKPLLWRAICNELRSSGSDTRVSA